MIFGEPVKCNSLKIPRQVLTNYDNYQGVTKEEVQLFIGKTSLSGLTIGEIASVFQWNAAYVGRAIANNKLTFSTLALILILCGENKDKLFYLDHT